MSDQTLLANRIVDEIDNCTRLSCSADVRTSLANIRKGVLKLRADLAAMTELAIEAERLATERLEQMQTDRRQALEWRDKANTQVTAPFVGPGRSKLESLLADGFVHVGLALQKEERRCWINHHGMVLWPRTENERLANQAE